MSWQHPAPMQMTNINGHWSAKRRSTSWSMHISETNGKLHGKAVLLTSLGDILEYTLLGYLHEKRATINLNFTRNQRIQAYLELEVDDDVLRGSITENDTSAFPIQFSRVIVVNYG